MTPPSSNSMPNDEIRARCEEYYTKNFPPGIDAAYGIPGIESLCREMIAVGLERAADDAAKRTIHAESNAEGQNEDEFKLWLEVGQGHRLQERWCRAEAQKLKEHAR